MVTELSEPDGEFRSDNLLSNELFFQTVIPELLRTSKTERVYLGVGPEQNFTYIAALKPRMAFIIDIRRGNLQLHLMYKALFEMSSRPRGFHLQVVLAKASGRTGRQVDGRRDLHRRQEGRVGLDRIEAEASLQAEPQARPESPDGHASPAADARRPEGHRLRLRHVFLARSRVVVLVTGGRGGFRDAPTYWDLMVADDGKGQYRSFLSSEENFTVVRDLHKKNLLVPVVGNFAGPKALRAVARYLKEREATVSAFYLSNVEQYLSREGTWYTFCGNVATLPLDESSIFIRSVRDSTYGPGIGLDSRLGNMPEQVKECAAR